MAACSQPEDSVRYLIKALEINPGSQRARQGMDWAIKRLRKLQQEQQSSVIKAPKEPGKVIPSQAQSPTSLTKNTMWLKVTGLLVFLTLIFFGTGNPSHKDRWAPFKK